MTGTFHNYSGMIASMDATAGTVTLKDLTTKKIGDGGGDGEQRCAADSPDDRAAGCGSDEGLARQGQLDRAVQGLGSYGWCGR